MADSSFVTSEPNPCDAQGNENPILEEFADFVKNEIQNPTKGSDLFKIPEGLTPDWQTFFEKVAAYHERRGAEDRSSLLMLGSRARLMKDHSISEFEMLIRAKDMKKRGDAKFRSEKFQDAFICYLDAITVFATPDVMNNAAACALKTNQFDLAEDFTTRALEMDLLASRGATKAYFRRATARLHLGKFESALQDVEAAQALTSDDSSVNNLLLLVQENMRAVKSQVEMANFLEKQPKPPPNPTFTQAMDWAKESMAVPFNRIPYFIQQKLEVPIF